MLRFDLGLTGRACYALAWRDADELAVWAGTAFAPDSDAARQAGAAGLSESPTEPGVYLGGPPAGLPAGGYPVTFWLRAGAAPATTDPGPLAREGLTVPPAGGGVDPAEAEARARSPWPEPVGYRSVRRTGDVAADVWADGVYVVGVREAAVSAGRSTVGDIRVTLPLPGVVGPPKPADVVTWEGVPYRVLDVSRSKWFPPPAGPFWVLTARNPAIAGDLAEVLTVKRPAVAPGAGGLRAVTAWATVLTTPGRLQVLALAVGGDPAGRLGGHTRAVAYVEDTVRVQPGDVVAGEDGVRWEVTGQRDTDTLATLTAIELEYLA